MMSLELKDGEHVSLKLEELRNPVVTPDQERRYYKFQFAVSPIAGIDMQLQDAYDFEDLGKVGLLNPGCGMTLRGSSVIEALGRKKIDRVAIMNNDGKICMAFFKQGESSTEMQIKDTKDLKEVCDFRDEILKEDEK